MTTLKTLINPGLTVILFLLFSACSKDTDVVTNSNLKSQNTGNKVFTGGSDNKKFTSGDFGKMFSTIQSLTTYANNTGNSSFTGNTPGSGGGGNLPTGSGYVNMNGGGFPLYLGFFAKAPSENNKFILEITDVTAQQLENEDEIVDFNGILFELHSESENTISPGTYDFSFFPGPLTFDYAAVVLHANSDYEEVLFFEEGFLTFAGAGTDFDISFEGELDNGQEISGNYSGFLYNEGFLP